MAPTDSHPPQYAPQYAQPVYQDYNDYQGGYQGGYNGGYPATGIPLASSGAGGYNGGYVQNGYAVPPVVYDGTPRSPGGNVAIVYMPQSQYGGVETGLFAPAIPVAPVEDSCPIILFVLGFCFPILWCGGFMFLNRRYGSTTRIFGALAAALSVVAVIVTIILIVTSTAGTETLDDLSSSSSSSSCGGFC